MNYRSVLLFTTAATFYGVSMGVLAVPLPGSVDVTGPDGSMSRWYLSNNNTYEGNVASNGTTIDRYDAFDGHHRLNVEGVFYQDADNDYAVTSNTDGTFIEYDANATGAYTTDMQWAFLNGSGVFRQYVTITNNSDGTGNLQFNRWHNMGSDGHGEIIASSDGDLLSESSDAWFATDDTGLSGREDAYDPAIIYSLFSGTGVSPTALSGGPATNVWQDVYDLSLAVGESISFLWFTQMHASSAGAVAGASLFDSISRGSELLVGLSSAQLDGVVNHSFGAAPGTAQVPAPATLALLGLGLVGLGCGRRFAWEPDTAAGVPAN